MESKEVDNLISMCEFSLSEIENYESREVTDTLLAGILLVVIVAEFEKKFNSVLIDRFKENPNKSVIHYFNNEKLVRHLRVEEILKLLKKFGDNHYETFRDTRSKEKQQFASYNNLILRRNDFAHGHPLGTTFLEVKEWYEEGKCVIDYFKDALWKSS